jgi:hypothetical protein
MIWTRIFTDTLAGTRIAGFGHLDQINKKVSLNKFQCKESNLYLTRYPLFSIVGAFAKLGKVNLKQPFSDSSTLTV